MRSVVLAYGSLAVPGDDIAFKIAAELEEAHPNLEVVKTDRPEALLDYKDYDLIVILDAVKDLDKPSIIEVDNIKAKNISTLHDFDLGFFLTTLTTLESDLQVKIIGLPMNHQVNVECVTDILLTLGAVAVGAVPLPSESGENTTGGEDEQRDDKPAD
jgi:Ni,Fe-hydrogenase maturation factor